MIKTPLSAPKKQQLVAQLQTYCNQQLDCELGEFDAEFLFDFVVEHFSPEFYNQGLRDAQVILQQRLYSITEAIEEIEQVV